MDFERIIAEAQARRDALVDEVHKLEAFIASAQALAASGGTPPARPTRSRPLAPARTSSASNPTREETAKILREHGAPLPTRDLLRLLRERGVDIGGKEPSSTLSARLSNSDEFKVHRGIGWWFKNEPLPNRLSFEEAAGQHTSEEPAASNSDEEGGDDPAAALE